MTMMYFYPCTLPINITTKSVILINFIKKNPIQLKLMEYNSNMYIHFINYSKMFNYKKKLIMTFLLDEKVDCITILYIKRKSVDEMTCTISIVQWNKSKSGSNRGMIEDQISSFL